MQRIEPPSVQETHPRIRDHIRAMLKMLMGETNRVPEMIRHIHRTDLPLDIRDKEGLVFEAIYRCHEEQLKPLPETVARLLEIQSRMSNPVEFIGQIMQDHKDDVYGLRSLGVFVDEWLREEQTKALGREILSMPPNMGYEEKHELIRRKLSLIAPKNYGGISMDEVEFGQLVKQYNQEMRDLRARGLAIGPTLPFPAAKAFYSHHRWGELTTIMGASGMGKTTLGQIVAEHNAWFSPLNCDVAVFTLETSLDTLALRQFSRMMYVPFALVSNSSIDLNSDRWSPVYDRYMAKRTEKNNGAGCILYYWSPGAHIDEVLNEMERYAEASRMMNRNIVFVIDYLQKFDWVSVNKDNEWAALALIGNMLAKRTRQIDAYMFQSSKRRCHTFLLAQEGGSRGEAWGSTIIKKISQLVFSIQRKTFGKDEDGNVVGAASDLVMTVPESSIPVEYRTSRWYQKKPGTREYIVLDELGNPRYWYRKGDEYDRDAILSITKANDGALSDIRLKWEGPMNIISQDPAQIAELSAAGRLVPDNVP